MTRTRRSAVVATALGVALLAAACTGGGSSGHTASTSVGRPTGTALTTKPERAPDGLATTPRTELRPGGTATWALHGSVATFNYYGRAANGIADTLLGALLPRPFNLTPAGTFVNKNYFNSVALISRSPETIEYKINPRARWSDGSALSYLDFVSMWKALDGSEPKFHTSRSIGYIHIASVTQGENRRDVIVKFDRQFAEWRSLFQPLLPASLTSSPTSFNTSWTGHPLVTAGPFRWSSDNPIARTYTIVRDAAWWGEPALLDSITFAGYGDPAAAVRALGTHEVDIDDISGRESSADVTAARRYPGISVRETGGQKPQVVAVTSALVNVGANGFGTYDYENIGFRS